MIHRNETASQPPAALETVAGQPVLRFERTLRHPPERVWTAVTDPAEMSKWFPATVETELRPGAPMRFSMDEVVPGTTDGEVLELDPPKVYAFRWNDDVLRFELLRNDDGCRLVFTHTLGGDWVGRLGAGRDAAGWDACLDALEARMSGEPFEAPTDWLSRAEFYVAKFGLDLGEVTRDGEDDVVRFARDLMWVPVADVWALLVEQLRVEVGDDPPTRFTNGYVPAGPVSAVEAPNVLEYDWTHDAVPAGRVRWQLAYEENLGVRAVLTQTVPAALADVLPTVLAAWHTHLELLFAAVLGEVRPWPPERTAELEDVYRERLAAR
jgi:uncharacterized protein YndB with AHSA1/START domain